MVSGSQWSWCAKKKNNACYQALFAFNQATQAVGERLFLAGKYAVLIWLCQGAGDPGLERLS